MTVPNEHPTTSIEERCAAIANTAVKTEQGVRLDLRIYLYPTRVDENGKRMTRNAYIHTLSGQTDARVPARDELRLIEELAAIVGIAWRKLGFD